jgi:uncharacterized protein (DUF1778 family)
MNPRFAPHSQPSRARSAISPLKQVLNAKRIWPLSERDARIFLSVLDSDQQPNQALRDAAAWYIDNFGGSLGD